MLGAPKPKRSDSYNSLQSPVEQSPTSLMMPETTSPQTQQTSYPHSRATSGAFGRPTRPPPRFDDNLRDLFPDDTPERQNFRNVAWQTTIPQQIAPPQQNLVFQRPNSHASASPISQFDPALRLQQQLTTSPSTNSQLYNTSFPSSNAPVNNPVSTFSNPQQPVSFEQFGFRSDLDDLLADTTTAYTGQPGLSLGFDSEHDWNDGWQPDMFDGFWFRGWSNGGGSGMPGDNGEGDEDMGG